MHTSRRDFVKLTAAAGAAGLGIRTRVLDATTRGLRSPHPLRILVLGGTGFIGPHMVRYALDRGHELTFFNRGRTNTHLFDHWTDDQKFDPAQGMLETEDVARCVRFILEQPDECLACISNFLETGKLPAGKAVLSAD